MLPPGHIAAGFLTAEVLLKISHQSFTHTQQVSLLWWGAFFGFAPDLDVFWFFYKTKSLLVSSGREKRNHRNYWSHMPLVWLLAGLLVFLVAPGHYWKSVGLLLWLGSWSHFLLDSVEYGVAWLGPYRPKLYALRRPGVKFAITETDFFKHSQAFLSRYVTTWSFRLEMVIIFSATVVYFLF